MNRFVTLLTTAAALALAASPLAAQTETTFTYQGELKENGGLANGAFNLDFSLWDAATAGNQIGPEVMFNGLPVTDGRFTVELDFGVQAFSTADHWLEVTVNGSELSPRTRVAGSPFSIQTRGIFVDENNNVGIGTNSPMSRLHVAGDGMFTGGDLSVWFGNKAVTLRQDGNSTYLSNKADFVSNGAESNGLLVINGEGGIALKYGSALSSGTDALIVDTSGNVGIGTSTPSYPLHVESNDTAIFGHATASSGLAYGVFGESASTSGRGVYGYATAVTGNASGVFGISTGTTGRGVYGWATSAGQNYGVYGKTSSSSGRGVYGESVAGTGTTYGGRFESDSTSGRGVYGRANAFTGTTYGVSGYSQSTSGRGVFGWANGTNGTTYGVYGQSNSFSGRGVFGEAVAGTGTTFGGEFKSSSTSGRGILGWATATSGSTYGVWGLSKSASGRGVFGEANAASGTTYGVFGLSRSVTGRGVVGEVTAATGNTFGVWGVTRSNAGRGVFGEATATSGVNFGVIGRSASSSGFDFYANGVGTNYGSTSSRRWKHNVEPISDPLTKLAQLRGVYFDWDEEHGGHHDLGMIAEEVGEVLPEIVNYEENGIDAIGMDYSKMTPLLVEAVNALRAEKDLQIDALHVENDSLRARLDSLERLVTQLASQEPERMK